MLSLGTKNVLIRKLKPESHKLPTLRSPRLFNMLMAVLPYELEKINGLRFAIYADDVPFWTNEMLIGDQKDIDIEGFDFLY